MSDIIQFNYHDHWKEEEINLERPNNGDNPLGFDITGGIDTPFVNDDFPFIIVTYIVENSVAYRDRRLKIYDLILRVNNIDFTNIKHKIAVDVLRTSGQKVQLLIRRLAPPISEEIELEHNGKLGVTIEGGIGAQFFRDDHGIFITDIDKSQTNKQLDIGDRLLKISSKYKTYDLRFVTLEEARKCIQLACEESKRIKLHVGHTRSAFREQSERTVSPQDQYDLSGSKDKVVSAEEHDIKTENHYEDCQTISDTLNKLSAKNRNEQNFLIESFDFDDYQRYENRGKVSQNRLLSGRGRTSSTGFVVVGLQQPHAIKSTTVPTVVDSKSDREVNIGAKRSNGIDQDRNSEVYDSHRNTVSEQRTGQQSKLEKAAIREGQAERQRREQSRMDQMARLHRAGATASGDGGLRWQVD